jgi:hypothetical protein
MYRTKISQDRLKLETLPIMEKISSNINLNKPKHYTIENKINSKTKLNEVKRENKIDLKDLFNKKVDSLKFIKTDKNLNYIELRKAFRSLDFQITKYRK